MKEREVGRFRRMKEKRKETLSRAYNAALLGTGVVLSYPLDSAKDSLPAVIAAGVVSINVLHKRNKKLEAKITVNEVKTTEVEKTIKQEPIFVYSNGYKANTWDELAKWVGSPAAIVSAVDHAANFIEYHPGDEEIPKHIDILKIAKLLRENVPDYFLALNNPDAEYHPKELNQKMDEMIERYEIEKQIKDLEQQFNTEPEF